MPDFDAAWTVSHLAQTLKRRVEADGAPIWVRGELTGVKRYASGHCYFSLRDDMARVDCTMWRSSVARLRSPLEEGSVVYALGHASVWEERTALRFNVSQVLPASAVGPAAQEAERVKQLLLRDGLLDPGRKRPVPEHATRIAVITSVAGAAVRDIITVAARRWPGVELFVINSSVQGATAAAELVAALDLLCHLEAIDCCIIGRGGGSKEDLVAFNDESVCRAIAACAIPVISAVGHEVDVTLADLVADLRAATPSQAAEFALPDRRDVEVRLDRARRRLVGVTAALLRARSDRVERTRDRMGSALVERVRRAERRLLAASGRLAPALARRVAGPREHLARIESRLLPAMRRRLAAVDAQGRALAASLNALSPLAVLGRGYAVARDPDGRLLRRAAQFTPGSPFTLTVSDGTVAARTEDSHG
ncbi:MAG: exodeoxyribonuclease VII large subunit [Gemmatimonadales bacterium]|nr:exodeoxyribonuclease VII large subunit [Gemmatimonadales bacterium]